MNIKKHKSRNVLLAISMILSFAVLIFLIYIGEASIKNISVKRGLSEMLAEDDWLMSLISYFGGYFVIVCIVALLILVFLSIYESSITTIVDDISISEKQFPELLEFEKECVKRFGLKEIPKLYVAPWGTASKDVFGVNFDNKHIIRIDAPDIFTSANEGYYIAKLTIVSKLAAIKMGYYSIPLNLSVIFSHWIPILNQLNNRVMYYECDKWAVAVLGKETVLKAIISKYTGYYITPFLNNDEYIRSMEDVLKNKDVIYENLMQNVPIVAYRIEAIVKDIDGRLF